MGNCVAVDHAIVQPTAKKREQSSKELVEREKKIVKLRLGQTEEEIEYSNGKAMRIKVVVTQKELIEILRNKSKYSSIEQLLGSMKVKNRRIVHAREEDRGATRRWRPALESIGE